ncbi:hypothetical protein EC988_003090 [Linderina pennispora]|nr:hypothetical protein EC988_003090 [Linderina pennispora]
MTTHIPLSLRRKIVIALDINTLVPASVTASEAEASERAENRLLSFKTVAWAKANLIREQQDHVFLVTTMEAPGALDGKTISAMWNSMMGDTDQHVDVRAEAEAALQRLSQALYNVGVSATTEVLQGNAAEAVSVYVHEHRGEILVVQAPERGMLAMTYSWAELCAQMSACPTVMVKKTDLPENIAVALDPPLPTATTEETAEE